MAPKATSNNVNVSGNTATSEVNAEIESKQLLNKNKSMHSRSSLEEKTFSLCFRLDLEKLDLSTGYVCDEEDVPRCLVTLIS